MKTFKTGMIIFIILSIGIILGALVQGIIDSSNNKGFKINLPEEASSISTNSSKPDTLITWINKDTINLRFLIAARNYPKENH